MAGFGVAIGQVDRCGQEAPSLPERISISRQALLFLILIAAQSGEVRGATWGEIDFGAAFWTIPAERMGGNIVFRSRAKLLPYWRHGRKFNLAAAGYFPRVEQPR